MHRLTPAVKAALVSSSTFILVLVGWQWASVPQHRSIVDSLTYCLWVVPLFGIVALLNWISAHIGRRASSPHAASGEVSVVLVVGLALLVSESTRSLGGGMTRLQFGVTLAFALVNAACLMVLLALDSRRARNAA